MQGSRLFGPYPNSQAVHDSLLLLQKLFQVRQCDDSTFKIEIALVCNIKSNAVVRLVLV
jgi:excinuclease UvrABC nuclease subunit